MGNGITDFIEDNSAAVQNTAVGIASIGLEKLGKTTASRLVQPVVWVLDPNSATDEIDLSLGVLGLMGGAMAFATAVTGVVKGVVDDDIRRKMNQVHTSEPRKYTNFIRPCVDYSHWAGGGINAQTIASKGGVAWEHPNGIWAYIVDARGKLVCDYQPEVAKTVYGPHLPLRPAGDGFRWRIVRG